MMPLAWRSMGHSTRHCEPHLRRGNPGAARVAAMSPWILIVAAQCAPALAAYGAHMSIVP